MRSLFLFLIVVLPVAVLSLSCNQTRDSNRDTSSYDVITEKSYIIRNIKPVSGDPLVDSVMKLRQEMISYLERHAFSRHVAGKDSLLFRRNNGLEVLIELPPPEDIWQAQTIIAFDPQKNPLFINLHKDTTQVAHYVK